MSIVGWNFDHHPLTFLIVKLDLRRQKWPTVIRICDIFCQALVQILTNSIRSIGQNFDQCLVENCQALIEMSIFFEAIAYVHCPVCAFLATMAFDDHITFRHPIKQFTWLIYAFILEACLPRQMLLLHLHRLTNWIKFFPSILYHFNFTFLGLQILSLIKNAWFLCLDIEIVATWVWNQNLIKVLE